MSSYSTGCVTCAAVLCYGFEWNIVIGCSVGNVGSVVQKLHIAHASGSVLFRCRVALLSLRCAAGVYKLGNVFGVCSKLSYYSCMRCLSFAVKPQ